MPEGTAGSPVLAKSRGATEQQAGGGQAEEREPLPIWFFVGLILLVFGVIVVASGALGKPPTTVLGETRPSLWWGGVMTLAGAIFLILGLGGRHRP